VILSLKETLMRRDGLSGEEADEVIAEARGLVVCGANPEEVLMETFDLEPDYFLDLI
jgi:hypothetical protein